MLHVVQQQLFSGGVFFAVSFWLFQALHTVFRSPVPEIQIVLFLQTLFVENHRRDQDRRSLQQLHLYQYRSFQRVHHIYHDSGSICKLIKNRVPAMENLRFSQIQTWF